MHRFLCLACVLMLAACQPHDTSATKTDIKARQDLMHQWGKAYDAIKNMVKQPDTFDAAAFTKQTALINDSKTQMWRYFLHNTDTPDNRVNRLIQQNPEDFRQATNDFDVLIEQLYHASKHANSIDDVKTPFNQVKTSCKNCHKTYKKL